MAMASMRGLQMFITEIRNCQNGDQERARVEKELTKIRTKFSYEKSLSSYEKRKYVWKLLYIHILGYELDFGHREVLSLVGSPKYSEKQVGYMVTSCLLHENHEFLNYVIKPVRLDIIGRSETYQCLALTMVGNIGGRAFAEALVPDVMKLVVSSSCRPLVRKKAILCLLHLYRKYPDVVQVDAWPDHMTNLLDEKDFGVLLAVMNFLVALAGNSPDRYYNCISKCVRILERLLRNQGIPQEYTFYGIPSPWLQVKTLQVLQLLPMAEDPFSVRLLLELLERVVIGTDIVQNINRTNIMHAILFEAIVLVMQVDAERALIPKCVALLGKFMSLREPNIRYFGMETMTRMLLVANFRDSIRVHEPDVMLSLRDPDRSIQKVALDLLYEMCDATNAKHIVEEFLEYFANAEFEFQADIAAKTGLLAEKFATDLSWYVDVILQLVERGGGLVPDDIWRGLIQCVSKNETIQVYAVTKAQEYIGKPTVHETMVKVAGSLLGENSHLLAQKPGYGPKQIFWVLHEKFPNVSTPTKAVLLAAYIKLLLNTQPADEELQKQVLPIFEKYGTYLDAELQQRAIGYFSLSQKGPSVQEIPKSSERQESAGPSSRQSVPNVATQASEIDLLGDLMAPLVIGTADPFANALLPIDAPAMVFPEDPFSAILVPQPSVVQPIGNVTEWFNALCKKDSGILYEDPYIQIGIKAQWQGAHGQMSLFFGNKQSAPITSIRSTLTSEPHLKLELVGVPDSIQPSAQVPAVLKVTSLYASRAVPVFDFSYSVSGIIVAVKIRLPIVINKFLQATRFSASDFFASWRALVTLPNKLQDVIQQVRYSSVSDFVGTFNSLNINVAAGLDPNVNNLVAATTFYSETGGATLCMARVETDPADRTQFRLSVASADARLAMELKEYIKEHLLGSLSASPLVNPSAMAIDANPPAMNPNPFGQPEPDFISFPAANPHSTPTGANPMVLNPRPGPSAANPQMLSPLTNLNFLKNPNSVLSRNPTSLSMLSSSPPMFNFNTPAPLDTAVSNPAVYPLINSAAATPAAAPPVNLPMNAAVAAPPVNLPTNAATAAPLVNLPMNAAAAAPLANLPTNPAAAANLPVNPAAAAPPVNLPINAAAAALANLPTNSAAATLVNLPMNPAAATPLVNLPLNPAAAALFNLPMNPAAAAAPLVNLPPVAAAAPANLPMNPAAAAPLMNNPNPVNPNRNANPAQSPAFDFDGLI